MKIYLNFVPFDGLSTSIVEKHFIYSGTYNLHLLKTYESSYYNIIVYSCSGCVSEPNMTLGNSTHTYDSAVTYQDDTEVVAQTPGNAGLADQRSFKITCDAGYELEFGISDLDVNCTETGWTIFSDVTCQLGMFSSAVKFLLFSQFSVVVNYIHNFTDFFSMFNNFFRCHCNHYYNFYKISNIISIQKTL